MTDTNTHRHLVIGMGEVGKALAEVLGCQGIDVDETATPGAFDFIHIAFPWSDTFVDAVKGYKGKYLRSLGTCVIHSTVPIGTSAKCGAVHSPIRGIHPHLAVGIRTFTKFLGGYGAMAAAAEFERLGIKVHCVAESKATEALKLWDTTQYGLAIVLQKEIARWCQENSVPFDVVYTAANETYNQGYRELGRPEFTKYALRPMAGPIGGHCVLPNCRLLDSWVAEMVLELGQDKPVE